MAFFLEVVFFFYSFFLHLVNIQHIDTLKSLQCNDCDLSWSVTGLQLQLLDVNRLGLLRLDGVDLVLHGVPTFKNTFQATNLQELGVAQIEIHIIEVVGIVQHQLLQDGPGQDRNAVTMPLFFRPRLAHDVFENIHQISKFALLPETIQFEIVHTGREVTDSPDILVKLSQQTIFLQSLNQQGNEGGPVQRQQHNSFILFQLTQERDQIFQCGLF